MQILNVRWFTGRDCIGIVRVQTDYNGIQYFIGKVDGIDAEDDARYVADWGSRFDPAAGRVLFGVDE